MSRIVETSELHPYDLFELPHGSVYEVHRHGTAAAARLWCAHAPDVPIAEPPLIDLPALPTVHLLSRHDQGSHTTHAGYVRHVFEHEMDRRHHERMQGVYERQTQAAAETRQHAPARRPWWKKLFA
jgi:hypothetical protein